MHYEQRQHLEELRNRHQRRLRELELQAATRGLSTPPEIRMEIEDIWAEIFRIDTELAHETPGTSAIERTPHSGLRHNLPAQTTLLIGREREATVVGVHYTHSTVQY